ncbi:MAG: hypothetical protein QXP57_07145 [Nitrososphaerota archaeon]
MSLENNKFAGKVKNVIAIGLIAALLLTSFAVGFSLVSLKEEVEVVWWPDPATWYMNVDGTLSSDDFPYFPYNTTNLNIGFSKFGEMIDMVHKKGLEFGAVDPFAPPGGPSIGSVPEYTWLNGWTINITYSYRILPGVVTRNVWAVAIYSDRAGVRGPWLRVDFPAGDCAGTSADGDSPFGYKHGCEDPIDRGHVIWDEHYTQAAYPYNALHNGGRKTNGTVITEPINVLYEDNRRFVAVLVNHVYDHPEPGPSTEGDIHLVDVVFTIDFYKDKHQVIVLKDIKSKISEKELEGRMNIQFSNRGEWDLGTEQAGYASYYHFYTEGNCSGFDTSSESFPTEYTEDYHLLLRDIYPFDTSVSEPGKTCYARYRLGGEDDGWDRFDLFQAINPGADVVGYAAFWPPLSDWSAYGWAYALRSMDAGDPHYIDAPTPPGEPSIPYVIGEWDFELSHKDAPDNAFRGVTVYGVTELVEADDQNIGIGHSNIPEDEVLNYTLQEVFNPWDLRDASRKDTFRWAYIAHVPVGLQINLTNVAEEIIPEENWRTIHIVPDDEWDDYSVFAERIFDLTTGKLLVRGVNYNISGTIIYFESELKGHLVKILFSTVGEPFGRYEWIIVGRDSNPIDSAGAAMVAAALKNKDCATITLEDEDIFLCTPIEVGLAGFDMWNPGYPTAASVMKRFGPGTTVFDFMFNPAGGDYRTAFLNHWPNNLNWSVKTSNIIAVGGPGANLVSDYFNSFSQAIFRSSSGMYWRIGGPPYDWLIPSDWGANRIHPYPDRAAGEGLAVITTYKDLDGTVGLVVYGATGEDTWWATHWLYDIHGDHVCFTYYNLTAGQNIEVCGENGLRLLQNMNPGVTTIVLSIKYPSTMPPFTPDIEVIKLLGTISTKTPKDP